MIRPHRRDAPLRLRFPFLLTVAVGVLAIAPAFAQADGRRYEMVSPVEKNGGDVVGDGQTVVAGVDGTAVAYASRVSFADSRGSGSVGQTQYVARRTPHGWNTRAITPTPAQGTTQIFITSTSVSPFSDDLRRAVVYAYDLPGVDGDAPDMGNVYMQDTETGSIVPISVSRADPISIFDFLNIRVWGASSDLRHVAFVTGTRFLPEAPAGVSNVYEWVDGSLRIAGVLPDGSIPASGSSVVPLGYRNTISADGSRLAFTAAPIGNQQLYVRIEGTRTVQVSQSEAAVEVEDAADVVLRMITDDGHHVLFTTSSRLVDEDTNDGVDLYLFTESADPARDRRNLTLISTDGDIAGDVDATTVVGASQDATRIYFQNAGSDLLLWDHARRRLVSAGVLHSADYSQGTRLSVTDTVPGASRVSDDGRRLAFLSSASLGNDTVHALTGEVTNSHVEMYVYDASADTLVCVSCPSGVEGTADATVVPHATQGTATRSLVGARPRYLSSDGRRVFFSTREALVSEDTNGVVDTYEYDTTARQVSLISPGSGSEGSWFVDANATGDNVFFTTRQALVRADRDQLVDLYDARVGGGFQDPAPPSSPCTGESCQGTAAPAPGEAVAATVSFRDAEQSGGHTARIAIRKTRVAFGARATLLVKLSSAGRLRCTGRGVKSATLVALRPGKYRVALVLKRDARQRLGLAGIFRAPVKLVFVTAEGTEARVRTVVTFKTELSRKGR